MFLMLFKRRKTVAGVIVKFQKVVDDLVDVAGRNVYKAHDCQDEITILEHERDEAFAEAKAAHRIREKIEALISGA